MRGLEEHEIHGFFIRDLSILPSRLGPHFSSGRAIAAESTRKTLSSAYVFNLARLADPW